MEDGLPSAASTHDIFSTTHCCTFVSTLNNIRVYIYHSFETVIDTAGITSWNEMWDGRGVFGGDENLDKYNNILSSNYESDEADDVEFSKSWNTLDFY